MIYVIALPFLGVLLAAKLLRRYLTANDAWRYGESEVSK